MRINEEMHLLTAEDADGKVKKERITDETPPPAHVIE